MERVTLRTAAAVMVASLALAACAKSSSTATPGQGGGLATKPPAATGQIGTADVSGVGVVLHDGEGFTLYHLTTEKNGKIDCTGSCTSTWPPLLAKNGQLPAAMADLSGKLSTVTRPDGGVQITFDGMPLYTYSGDSAPGQANGNGVSGVWYAVAASGVSSGSGGSSSGGYGNGGGGGGYGGGS